MLTGPASVLREPAPSGERRKQLGAFYTPSKLAQAMADWAVRSARDRVLDPAAGEAVFLVAAGRRLRSLGAPTSPAQLFGIDVNAEAIEAAHAILKREDLSADIEQDDFFRRSPLLMPERFDAIIGNPPYIRYHRFRGHERIRALASAEAVGVRLSGLT